MRILHTADWHIGRTIRGRSRAAEFEAVLAELVGIARAEQVEAMLVCGDIWETATPTPEADRLVFEALRECIGLGIQVVLIAGNHDSPRKLEALGMLSELLGVQTQWRVNRPEAGGILNIEGREHVARIAAIPWLREGDFVDAAQLMGLEEDRYVAYADGAGEIHRAMCTPFTPDTVNILAGHVFLNGARYAARDGSERQLHIGQAYGIAPAALPPAPQYIALGHIHSPQRITDAPVPTEYAGSLLQLDFGEAHDEKRVVIVDAVPGRPPDVRSISLTKGRRLHQLHDTFDNVLAQGASLGNAHIRVVLKLGKQEPGIAQRLRDQLPGVVDVQPEYPDLIEAIEEHPSLASLAPEEQFVHYYRAQHQADPAPETIVLFRTLHDAAVTAETEA